MEIRFFAVISALAGMTATLAHADPVHVQVAPNSFDSEAALESHIRNTLRGAEATIIAIDPVTGSVDLDAGDAAARALRADPSILNVGFISPVSPRLRRVMIEINGREVTANTVSREEGLDATVSGPTGWPGEVLAIEALDARGEVASTYFVRDPRFVRYEGWAADGSHIAGSNAAFVDETVPFDIILELPAEVESLRVFDRLDAANDANPRRDLGRVEISDGETVQ